MTALPTPTDVDELIRQNRAATPRAAVEARKVPRATIKELNELDIDEIRDRYVRTGYDDRSPVTKVLDLVDLPRNVVANIVFRGTGAVESEGLRRGAAGLPVVNTSDALKNLGVSNRVARGILGFVGDVALDPLTYLGPAGWGLQVADKAGRGVRIGAAGARGLKRGLKEVSAGQVIRHQPTRELFDTLLANAPDEIKAADNTRKAAYLSEKALGKVGAQSKAGTPFYFLSRSLGGDRQARGGAIAELLTKEGAEADAVRQFVSRAGSAAGPGIGKGGSQVAHIPFTDISVKTPGFTRAGRAAEEDLAIARSAAPRDISEYVSPTIIRSGQIAREVMDRENDLRKHVSDSKKIRQQLESEIEAARAAGDPNTASLETRLAQHEEASRQRTIDLQGEINTSAQNLKALVEQSDAIPLDIKNPRELFAIRKIQDEAQSALDLAAARAKADIDADLASRLNIEADQYADDTMEQWDRIVEQQIAEKAGGGKSKSVFKEAPVTFDDLMGDAQPNPMADMAPIGIPQRNTRIRQIRQEMKQMKGKRSKVFVDKRKSLRQEVKNLMLRATLHDETAGSVGGTGRDIAPPQYLPLAVDGRPVIPSDPVVRQRVAERARPILDQIDQAEEELLRLTRDSKKAAGEKDSLFAGQAIGQRTVDAATLEREQNIEAALQRLMGLRAQLEQVTSEVRNIPGVPIDEAREAARLAHFNSLDTAEKALADLADTDIAEAEAIADAVQETMAAYQRHYRAVSGAVEQTRQMSEQEDILTRLMARFLNTDERVIGRAGFAGPNAMLKVPGSTRAYRTKTTVFGERGTDLADEARKMRNAMSVKWRRDIETYIGTVANEIRKAFNDVGIKATGQQMDRANAIMYALAIQRQAMRGEQQSGRGILYTQKFDSNEMSDMLKFLEDAKKDGVFDPKIVGDLFPKLQAVADKYGADLLDELGRIELDAGLLDNARPGYFPNILTPGAREAVRNQRRIYGNAGGAARKQAQEAFQKERSTDQVRFVSQRPGMEGKERRIFGFELDQAQRVMENPGEIEALRSEGLGRAADAMEELVEDYREYLALPERPQFRATDPFELNALSGEGRFDLLLDGVNPVGGFMQTNMVAAIGERIAQHTRAMARRDWREYTSNFGIAVPDFRGKRVGDKIRAADGSEAKIATTVDSFGNEVPAAIIGGQKYRPVSNKYKNDDENPFIQMLGRENADRIYHEQVAAAIERAADIFSEDKANVVLRGLDELTRQWKSLTLLHPSWTIFNLIGDTVNALIGGANPASLFKPENAKFSAKLIRYMDQPEKLRDLNITIRGQAVNGEELLRQLTDEKVIDGTMMQETAFKLIDNEFFTLPSSAQGSGSVRKLRPAMLDADYKEMVQRYAMARGEQNPSRMDKIKAGRFVASDRYSQNFLGPWFRANAKVGNFMRVQTFLSFLEDGHDARSAASMAIRSQFDYSDMTRIERDIFRRMFPFYAWMRNNGAYQFKMLFERPGYAAAFPKVQQAIEEAIAGDEKVPLQMRPTWMRNALALQVSKDPDTRTALLFGGALPSADVYQYMTPVLGTDGIMDFLHYFASNVNPVANALLQLGTGQETFSGKTIGADPYSGDVSATDFLLNQIRPIAELRPGGKLSRAFERSTGEGIGRAILGGRFQDMSEDRLRTSRLREFKDVERRIRQSIARDERQGNPSVAGRAKLMELYAAMEDSGFADEVPKWARGQLQELG